MADRISGLTRALRRYPAPKGIRAIYLFGSHCRGDQMPNSDVDLLIEAQFPPVPHELKLHKLRLGRMLRAKIDIVRLDQLFPDARDHVLEEAIEVFSLGE